MSDTRPRFYLTTPIYYVNDVPHVGHAYTTVACDVLARYRRMRGFDVHFLTGTDEHGQKAQKSADAQGLSPQRLADRMAAHYKEAWKLLGISHDDFIRTTEPRHARGAQELWRRLTAAGDITKSAYRGPYCVGCESFYLESQLVDGRCPEQGHPVEVLEEESYFFRLSKYQQPLLDHYAKHPDFVVPESRMNEVVAFVERGLQDLSISRTKLQWGIPVPDDPAHVMYVWIDALANYVSAVGFGQEGGPTAWWPANLHVLGKDISRFHAVYWPAFLMSAGLPLPERLLVHGWWHRDGMKMSKSLGNVADPVKLVEWFGADAVRYFMMREIRLGADGNYSEEAVVDRINGDLANDLGNTLSRVTRIAAQELGGRIRSHDPDPRGLVAVAGEAWDGYVEAMDAHDPQAALVACWGLLAAINKLIVEKEPWKLAKDPARRAELELVMHEAAEGLRHVAVMLAPVMPSTARAIWSRLGLESDPFGCDLSDAGRAAGRGQGRLSWGFPAGEPVTHDVGLIPRIDKASFFADVRKPAPEAPASAREPRIEVEKPEAPGAIAYDDFAKVALRTARIVSAKKHPQADKLLVLELDDGSGVPRTICAGIASHYQPEQLAGRTVVIVANLAPRKLRGIESQGMLLAASWGEGAAESVRVLVLADDVPPGAVVR